MGFNGTCKLIATAGKHDRTDRRWRATERASDLVESSSAGDHRSDRRPRVQIFVPQGARRRSSRRPDRRAPAHLAHGCTPISAIAYRRTPVAMPRGLHKVLLGTIIDPVDRHAPIRPCCRTEVRAASHTVRDRPSNIRVAKGVARSAPARARTDSSGLTVPANACGRTASSAATSIEPNPDLSRAEALHAKIGSVRGFRNLALAGSTL
jgi:hypothetical protein